jgi:hypothetical protein
MIVAVPTMRTQTNRTQQSLDNNYALCAHRTCVDAPANASIIFPSVSLWSGADVCPALMCDFSHAAGLNGDARIGSNTLTTIQIVSATHHRCEQAGPPTSKVTISMQISC